jgi:heme exporter protein C
VITEPASSVQVEAVRGTGSVLTRVLGVAILVGLPVVAWLAFAVSGPDTELGETVRLLYVHVPSAITTYIACFVTAVASAVFLWKRSVWWDLVAEASAEIGAVYAVLTLATGMVWGKPTWGTYWTWDARLTTTAMLFLLLLGYQALRRTSDDPDVGARRAAVVGLLLVPNVLIVNRAVEWWEGLHQKATIVSLDPKIEGWQLFTWFSASVLMALVFAWLMIHRFRVAWLRRQAEAVGLDAALAERRAEADVERPAPSRDQADEIGGVR